MRHIQLIDEGLPRLIAWEPDEANDRDSRSTTPFKEQSGVEAWPTRLNEGIGRNRGTKLVRYSSGELGCISDLAYFIRQVGQQFD